MKSRFGRIYRLARAYRAKRAEQTVILQGRLYNETYHYAVYHLCYLSPHIVAYILEYNNPRNMSLKELMNFAEGESNFVAQEKRGTSEVDSLKFPVRAQGPGAGLVRLCKYYSKTQIDKKSSRAPSEARPTL